jgi:hypothetical protein
LNRVPSGARYWEIDEVSERRQWVIPAEGDRAEVKEVYSNGRGIGTVLAIGILALELIGLGYHIHNKHDLEELEHRKPQPVRVYPKKIIEKKPTKTITVPATTAPETEPGNTTTTTTTTTESSAGTSDNDNDNDDMGAAQEKSSGNSSSENTSDRDEPLSGRNSYSENSKKDGHGLELDTNDGTTITKKDDGTYYLTGSNGKTIRLRFNHQGKLTGETVRNLKAEHYEVGQGHSVFRDREGHRFEHAYSTIGDQDQ